MVAFSSSGTIYRDMIPMDAVKMARPTNEQNSFLHMLDIDNGV